MRKTFLLICLLIIGVRSTVVRRDYGHAGSLPAHRDVTLADRSNCEPGDEPPPNRVNTTLRVQQLREELANHGLDAYIIPSDDAHQNEFVGESDKRRQYISGFSGSAGTAVVLRDTAAGSGEGFQAVWTDGRYFLQADDQLDCAWLLMKEYMPGVPGILAWLGSRLPPGARVGADPSLTPATTWQQYAAALADYDIEVVGVEQNLVDLVWHDRPPYPTAPAYPLTINYTGKSWEFKVEEVRAALAEEGVGALVVTALDEVAWLLNLRGDDIPYSPVFRSYALVTPEHVTLFTPPEKLSEDVLEHLNVDHCDQGLCVAIRGYDEILDALRSLEDDPDVSLVSVSSSYSFTSGASFAVFNAVPSSKRHSAPSPILFLKGRKNEVEAEGMIRAHLKDAVALCDFFAFLENEILAGNPWDELSAAAKAEEFRAQQEDYVGLSFETISAFGPNAAIVHYSPTPETNRPIDDTSTFLLDSGAHYKDGTTDLTRTLHFGQPTALMVETYTRVLQGAMDFATMVFPEGHSLGDIEIFARRPLYEVGLDYRHGTSHGIGMFLYVHESSRYAYEEGFFGSDEPGYYEDGEFGIRLETTLRAVYKDTPYTFAGRMMGFEAAALVPFEPKLINATLLSRQQCEAVNQYHEKVREVVGAELLSQGRGEGYSYVLRKTQPLEC